MLNLFYFHRLGSQKKKKKLHILVDQHILSFSVHALQIKDNFYFSCPSYLPSSVDDHIEFYTCLELHKLFVKPM